MRCESPILAPRPSRPSTPPVHQDPKPAVCSTHRSFAGAPLRLAGRALAALAAVGLLLTGCTGGRQTRGSSLAIGGYPQTGKKIMVRYKCGSCHTVPGIGGANGVFGPPLMAMGRRSYIAGNFPNSPDNMVHWIMNPKSMKPATAMPDLNLSEQQARDVAAYLYTLQ